MNQMIMIQLPEANTFMFSFIVVLKMFYGQNYYPKMCIIFDLKSTMSCENIFFLFAYIYIYISVSLKKMSKK